MFSVLYCMFFSGFFCVIFLSDSGIMSEASTAGDATPTAHDDSPTDGVLIGEKVDEGVSTPDDGVNGSPTRSASKSKGNSYRRRLERILRGRKPRSFQTLSKTVDQILSTEPNALQESSQNHGLPPTSQPYVRLVYWCNTLQRCRVLWVAVAPSQ